MEYVLRDMVREAWMEEGYDNHIVDDLLIQLDQYSSMVNCGGSCPDSIKRWQALMVPRDPDEGLVEYVRRFAILRETVRNDPSYLYIRTAFERDVCAIETGMAQEIYMHGPAIPLVDVMEVMSYINIPEGIQSVIYDHLVVDAPSESLCPPTWCILLLFTLVCVCIFIGFRLRRCRAQCGSSERSDL